jgi:O-methyltransferase
MKRFKKLMRDRIFSIRKKPNPPAPENDFDALCQAVKDHTLLDRERLFSLWNLLQDVNARGIPGDVVECGSYKGGSSAVLRAAMGSHRKLWIYDSFQGMPATEETDGEEAKAWVGKCSASEEEVVEILRATGAIPGEYIVRQGWYQETFQQGLPDKIALLHCDADWYRSVTLVLDTFYPILSEGGCVILDDFAYWEGSRLAFYDFCEKQRIRPLIERVGNSQAYWIKGKAHRRNG